jgi:hypothetical protein
MSDHSATIGRMKAFVRAHRKMVVAALSGALTQWLAVRGFQLSPDMTGLLTTVITTALVYLVPNEQQQ